MYEARLVWNGDTLKRMYQFHSPLIFFCVDVVNSLLEAEKVSIDNDITVEYGGYWVVLRLIGVNNGKRNNTSRS